MLIFPEILPCIVINELKKEVFEVCAMQGLNQGKGIKQYTAQYRLMEDNLFVKTIEMVGSVKGYACVHGIHCLEFVESLYMFGEIFHELIQYIVITDTHIKTIAAVDEQGGVRVFHTFKDDDFNEHWGIGVDHCGMKINLKQEGIITRQSTNVLYVKDELPGTNDVIGRYLVQIGGKEFDTIRQIYIGKLGEITESYIDVNGNVILKRHFVLKSDYDLKKLNVKCVDALELGNVFYLNNKERICESYVLHDLVL